MTRQEFITERDQLLAAPAASEETDLPSKEFCQQFLNNKSKVRLIPNDVSDDGREYYEWAKALLLEGDNGEEAVNHINLFEAIDFHNLDWEPEKDCEDIVNAPNLNEKELRILWDTASILIDMYDQEDYEDNTTFNEKELQAVITKLGIYFGTQR